MIVECKEGRAGLPPPFPLYFAINVNAPVMSLKSTR